jgi:LuxR family transcriptional regulator
MTEQQEVSTVLGRMQVLAPAGFALALHIRFATPKFLLQNYDPAWIKYYSENGFVMSDPTVHWGFENEGFCRWSKLVAQDTAGVLARAAERGMRFGVTCAVWQQDSRSVASFARSDREYTEAESGALLADVTVLHAITTGLSAWSEATAALIKKMSESAAHPKGS